jgi:hypothetical protein
LSVDGLPGQGVFAPTFIQEPGPASLLSGS